MATKLKVFFCFYTILLVLLRLINLTVLINKYITKFYNILTTFISSGTESIIPGNSAEKKRMRSYLNGSF